MLERLLRPLVFALLARFERRWRYDMAYARTLWRLHPRGLLRFNRIAGLAAASGRRLPAALLAGAKVAALRLDDCGACLQLALDMAAGSGVDDADLRALAQGRVEAMGAEAALGYRYADAALRGPLDAAQDARAQLLARYGPRVLADLALAVVAARSFPSIKRLLGEAPSCRRLEAR
jgi:alkylhydroperoxidase family enzyme